MNRIFDLAENPGVSHRAATNQDAITTGFAKSCQCLIDCGDITTSRNGYADYFLDLFHEIPIGKPAIALLPGTAMQSDMLCATGFGQLCCFDGIDCVIVIAGANLDGHRYRDCLFDRFENFFQPLMVLQQSGSPA